MYYAYFIHEERTEKPILEPDPISLKLAKGVKGDPLAPLSPFVLFLICHFKHLEAFLIQGITFSVVKTITTTKISSFQIETV